MALMLFTWRKRRDPNRDRGVFFLGSAGPWPAEPFQRRGVWHRPLRSPGVARRYHRYPDRL